jgi:hypothetical protein
MGITGNSAHYPVTLDFKKARIWVKAVHVSLCQVAGAFRLASAQLLDNCLDRLSHADRHPESQPQRQ